MNRFTQPITDAIAAIFAKPPSPGLFAESLELVRFTENRLAKADRRSSISKPFDRTVIVPSYLLFRGFAEMVGQLGWIFRLLLIMLAISLVLASFSPVAVQTTANRFLPWLMLAVVLLYVFAAPSTYCSPGVNAKHVTAVRDAVATLDAKRIELVIRNINLFEDRVKRRLVAFRWVVGVGWGVYFLPTLSKVLEPSFALQSAPVTAMVAVLTTYVLVEAYSRGVNIVFRSLNLGCNERLAELAKLKPTSSESPNST